VTRPMYAIPRPGGARTAAPPRRRAFVAALVAVLAALAVNVPAAAAHDDDPGERGSDAAKRAARADHGHGHAEARNMQLVGMDDLQARSAYQPTIRFNPIAHRWVAYVGHHAGTAVNPLTGEEEPNGTSIVDVTDPRRPKYLFHIPGQSGSGEAGGAQMARVCNGSELPKGDAGKVYLLRTSGTTSHEIWDVTDPAEPKLLTTVVSGLLDTHKNFWECNTGIAYLVSGVPGWRAERMSQIFDLSDPAHPVHIRDFGLPGQEPGSTGPVPTDLHGPISLGDRVYFGYGTSSGGIMQIVDREKLVHGDAAPTPANLLAPQISQLALCTFCGGAHTTFPVLGIPVDEFAHFGVGQTRDFAVIANEATANECIGQFHEMVYFADITDPAKPQVVSNYHVDERSGHFCERGGRFGAHSTNENMTPIYYKKIVFVAYFNAGVRAVDMRDPYQPEELGYYIPSTTENTDPRCVTVNGQERCKTAIQTNNVEVDDRGYIYAVDRANTGMHILRVTGRAARVAAGG
jgi:hypothetical protein